VALRLSSTAGRGALAASALASGMAFLDGTVVNVALPRLGADLHATVSGLQWTVTAYALTLAAFVLLGGALGDRYGRRRVFLVGVAAFCVCSVLCGLSWNVGILVAARTFQGCGAALLTPTSLALLHASFDERDRARAIGAWSGLSAMSTAVGPFLGGWLIDALSWRWIFFLNVPFAVVASAAALRWVPETRSGAETRFDLGGALLAAAGLGGTSYALIQQAWWAVAVGVVALAGLVAVELRRGDAAMLPPRLFRSGQFAALGVVTLFIYAGLSGIGFFLIVELQTVVGYSALVAGTSMLPLTVLLLIGSAPAGALAARIGPRWLLTAGPLIGAAGVALMWRIGPGAGYFTEVLPPAVLLGLGLTTLVAPLTAATLAAAPDELSGVASGVSNAVARTAGLLAVATLPFAVGLSGQQYRQPQAFDAAYHRSLWYSAGCLVAGALLAAVFVGSGQRRPEPTQSRPVDRAGHRAQ
jgi:EmrB/QacA subfamily drug resistance transporter